MSRRHLLIALLAVATALLAVPPARAGDGVWTGLGPDGGDINSVVVDPAHPGMVYAATQGGVFSSSDGGGAWALAGLGLAGRTGATLALAPRLQPTLYVAAFPSVYRSRGAGTAWIRAGHGIPRYAGVAALAVDPDAPRTVYAGASNTVFRSTNGGARWSRLHRGLPDSPSVTAVAVTQHAVYAAAAFEGVFVLTAGGSWRSVSDGLPKYTEIRDLVAISDSLLYAATDAGVYRTTDGGASWSAAHTGMDGGNYVYDLDMSPSQPSTIYASTNAGVFKTIDGAASWSLANAGLPTGFGVVRRLAVSAEPADTVFAATDEGLFRTTDGGTSWQRSDTGIVATSVASLAAPFSDEVFATTREAAPVLNDENQGWQTVAGLPQEKGGVLTLDPSNHDTIYAGTDTGLFRSTDTGETWSSVGPPASAIAIAASDPQTIYVASEGGLQKTIDGSATWTTVDTSAFTDWYAMPLDITGVLVDPADANTVYVPTLGKGASLFKSTDGGATWSRSGAGLPGLYGPVVTALAIDPAEPSRLYAAAGSNRMFVSGDRSTTWSAVGGRLPKGATVNVLLVDPTDPSIVYAGTYRGIFRSTDQGRSWTGMNSGLRIHRITALVLSADGGALYAGTDGGGVFRFPLA